MKTQHHDGTRLRRTISQIEPRRGLKFVKSFVRRAALAAVYFTVKRNGANCAPTRAGILNARHARALGCTAVYGFCMAVDDFGMAPGDPERTPRMSRWPRKWQTAVLSVQEKTGTIASARQGPQAAARGYTTA